MKKMMFFSEFPSSFEEILRRGARKLLQQAIQDGEEVKKTA
jgi:hypothetical protein